MAYTQRKRRGGGKGKGKGKKHTPKNHYGIVNEITAITNGLGAMSFSAVRPASASASASVRRSASRGPKSVKRSVYNPLGRQTRTGRVPKVPATIRENVEEAEKHIANAKVRAAARANNAEFVKLFEKINPK